MTPVEESMVDLHRLSAQMADQLVEASRRVQGLVEENRQLREDLTIATEQWSPDTRAIRRAAAILRDFYHAPMTLSSVQPILTLAVELNPGMGK